MEELLGTEENNTANEDRDNERLQKAQTNRMFARIYGTLMVGLMAVHWYNIHSIAFSDTHQPITSWRNAIVLLFDVAAVAGLVIANKRERVGSRLLLTAVILRAVWGSKNYLMDNGLLPGFLVLGLISAVLFLRAYYLRLDGHVDILRQILADELHSIAWILCLAPVSYFILSIVTYLFKLDTHLIWSNGWTVYIVFSLLCSAGAILARWNEFSGGMLIVFLSLVEFLFVLHFATMGLPLTIAACYITSGVLFIVGSYYHKPKPEPLPEVEE